MPGVRLTWDGKRSDVRGLALPLQVVEEIGVARANIGTFDELPSADDGWRNRLIWGDNAHVLASLADELAGRVDLVYIDPPFDSRQDKVRINVGDATADESLAKISRSSRTRPTATPGAPASRATSRCSTPGCSCSGSCCRTAVRSSCTSPPT